MSLIFCNCGCGNQLDEIGSQGRLRKYIKGHSNKNTKFSIEHKLKLSLAKRGKPSNRLGYVCSNETKRKISKSNSGKYGSKSSNWKGGITTLNKCIRTSDRYKEWRTQIFIRHNFTCQECGKINCYIEVHHIKPLYRILKENNIQSIEDALNCIEIWNPLNGITLCKECHKKYRSGNTKMKFVITIEEKISKEEGEQILTSLVDILNRTHTVIMEELVDIDITQLPMGDMTLEQETFSKITRRVPNKKKKKGGDCATGVCSMGD